MNVSRRSFLGYCIASAAALGLSQIDLFKLKSALAKPGTPKVIWLAGSGCSGCSVSFLNRVSDTAPAMTTASLLTEEIDLVYHPTIMSAAGELASSAALDAAASGHFILVVEGGVPTAFDGAAGWAWTRNGEETTLQQAITDFSNRADAIIAVGSCASFGGVSASGPNPGGVKSVSEATGKSVINVPGCPAHPDWLVWTIAQLLANNNIALDGIGRPTELFGKEIHANCPRLNNPHASSFGVDNQCLIKLGCAGPGSKAPCPTMKWNNGVNWCVDANSPCLGCVEPGFPDAGDFYNI